VTQRRTVFLRLVYDLFGVKCSGGRLLWRRPSRTNQWRRIIVVQPCSDGIANVPVLAVLGNAVMSIQPTKCS